MATTKIKPIKSTVSKAIKYICSVDKTAEGIYIDSFCCSPETAATEFALTAGRGNRSKDKGTLAYHLIQSFKPGEVLAEEAHEIGKQYAKAVLKENYEYVITTHIDKDHIHNHIIFNAVSHTDHRKYNDCTSARYFREKSNDEICREHGLSVIEKKSGVRGRGKYEYEQAQRGESWKARLKGTIDECVEKAEDFGQFLEMMRSSGYEIKQGKYLSFRAESQSRFTRSKRIGEMYTEENIKKRILNKESYITKEMEYMPEKTKNISGSRTEKGKTKDKAGKIAILIDIKNNLIAQKSVSYKNKLVLENMNRMVETINFLEKNGFETNADLLKCLNETRVKYDGLKNEMRAMEDEMRLLADQIKFTKNYWNYKKVHDQSQKEAVDSPFWTEENMKKIVLFENAESYLKKNNLKGKDLGIRKMIDRYNLLRTRRGEIYSEYKSAGDSLKKLQIIKDNVESVLGISIDIKNRETGRNQYISGKEKKER